MLSIEQQKRLGHLERLFGEHRSGHFDHDANRHAGVIDTEGVSSAVGTSVCRVGVKLPDYVESTDPVTGEPLHRPVADGDARA